MNPAIVLCSLIDFLAFYALISVCNGWNYGTLAFGILWVPLTSVFTLITTQAQEGNIFCAQGSEREVES